MRWMRTVMAPFMVAVSVISLGVPAGYAADYPGVHDCPERHVCVWTDIDFHGTRQAISGYADYTDLNGHLHDRASSWVNANYSTIEWLGEWHRGKPFGGSYLKPRHKGTDLRDDITHGRHFNDRADFVARNDWYNWKNRTWY